MNDSLLYQIGLTLIPNVGDVSAKTLVAYCGSAEAVFREKKSKLEKIPDIGPVTASSIVHQKILARAEEELKFIEKQKVQALFFLDPLYPRRLLNCADSPILLYYKGKADLNAEKILAVVGTRNASEYGIKICEKIIEGLSTHGVLILSGMAYGIDITAHKAAMKEKIPTVGVLAHGLDQLYPKLHSNQAQKMMESGGLITEYMSGTSPEKENFPTRNRIVAGMCDALLVVESGARGGSLITAEIGLSYNRDVFAIPGRAGDMYSKGCNALIRTNKAGLVESAEDILFNMTWDLDEKPKAKKAIQREMFLELSSDEQLIVDALVEGEKIGIDALCTQVGISMGKASSVLLKLEFSGIVRSLPGKRYELV